MFKLQFETDNAAFEGDNLTHEIARILRETASGLVDFNSTRQEGPTMDVNGNVVGHWKITGN